MIKSKEDYRKYLIADKNALGVKRKFPIVIIDDIWRFQRLLRKIEYYTNTKNKFIYKPYISLLKFRYYRLGSILGFSIPINVFGPGLNIAHVGTVVVNGNAKIGKNCRIHACTNIGTQAGYKDKAPRIGDNVYIGPGVKIYGDITIGNDIAIGANSVVNKSFVEDGITIGGIPAKKNIR